MGFVPKLQRKKSSIHTTHTDTQRHRHTHDEKPKRRHGGRFLEVALGMDAKL